MLYIESLVIIGCINVVAVCGLVLLVGYTGIFLWDMQVLWQLADTQLRCFIYIFISHM